MILGSCVRVNIFVPSRGYQAGARRAYIVPASKSTARIRKGRLATPSLIARSKNFT
jgi:hypothetical protein